MSSLEVSELLRKADAYEHAGRERAAPHLSLFAEKLRALALETAPPTRRIELPIRVCR